MLRKVVVRTAVIKRAGWWRKKDIVCNMSGYYVDFFHLILFGKLYVSLIRFSYCDMCVGQENYACSLAGQDYWRRKKR